MLRLTTTCAGIELWGTRSFVTATTSAIELISQTKYFAIIKDAFGFVTQRFRTADRIEWTERRAFIGHATWRSSSAEYATLLVWYAARWRYYAMGIAMGDEDIEATCATACIEVLKNLDAPEAVIDKVWRRVFLESLLLVNPQALARPKINRIHCTASRFGWLPTFGNVVVIDAIRVRGCRAFLENTRRALELLKGTDTARFVHEHIYAIDEAALRYALAQIQVSKTKPRVYVSPQVGENGSSVEYAGLLAHEAYHNVLYASGSTYAGAEAERQCVQKQLAVLTELNAPQELLRQVEHLMLFPTSPRTPDEEFWRRVDWRQSNHTE